MRYGVLPPSKKLTKEELEQASEFVLKEEVKEKLVVDSSLEDGEYVLFKLRKFAKSLETMPDEEFYRLWGMAQRRRAPGCTTLEKLILDKWSPEE